MLRVSAEIYLERTFVHLCENVLTVSGSTKNVRTVENKNLTRDWFLQWTTTYNFPSVFILLMEWRRFVFMPSRLDTFALNLQRKRQLRATKRKNGRRTQKRSSNCKIWDFYLHLTNSVKAEQPRLLRTKLKITSSVIFLLFFFITRLLLNFLLLIYYVPTVVIISPSAHSTYFKLSGHFLLFFIASQPGLLLDVNWIIIGLTMVIYRCFSERI